MLDAGNTDFEKAFQNLPMHTKNEETLCFVGTGGNSKIIKINFFILSHRSSVHAFMKYQPVQPCSESNIAPRRKENKLRRCFSFKNTFHFQK